MSKSSSHPTHQSIPPPVLELSLTQLSGADIIRRLDDEPDLTYIFKHQLVQETTYDTMLKTKRADLHRMIAETIEKLAPDDIEQNAAVLAFHYQRGGWDDMAFVYAALAGDVAWRAYAHAEALTHYDFAIAMAGRLDTGLFNQRIRQVYSKRGRIFEVLGQSDAAIENYRAMIAFAQRTDDALMEVEGLNHLVTVQSISAGENREADQHLERALELARQAGDQALIGRTLWNMGLVRRFSDLGHATEFFLQSLEIARGAKFHELAGYALTELTIQNEMLGRAATARDYANQALTEFRALDNQSMVVDALAGRSVCSFYLGDVDDSRAAAEEGIQISRATENLWGRIYNQLALLQSTCDMGEFDVILSEGQDLLTEIRTQGFPPFQGFALSLLMRVHLELGELMRVHELSEECFQSLERMGVQIWMDVGRNALGAGLLYQGKLDEARAMLDPLWHVGDDRRTLTFSLQFNSTAIPELALAQGRLDFGLAFCDWILGYHTQEKTWRMACDVFFARARLYRARGDLAAAEQDFERAREIAERTRYLLLLWKVDAELAALYLLRDNKPRADAARQRAATLTRELAQKISDPKLRAAFLARPEIIALTASAR